MSGKTKFYTTSHLFGWFCMVYTVIILVVKIYTAGETNNQEPYSFMWWLYLIAVYAVILRGIFFGLKIFNPPDNEL